MRLYYSPNGCSISPHLALEEIGRPFEVERLVVAEGATRTETFLSINPKGKTPVLELDDGTIVTENPVILQYLARSCPDSNLLPKNRRQEFEALSISEYFSNTVHNFGLTPLFRPQFFCDSELSWEGIREKGKAILQEAFNLIAPQLKRSTFLFHDFSVADASVFYSEMHASRMRIGMPASVRAHFEALMAKAGTQRVLAREGLDPAAFLPTDA